MHAAASPAPPIPRGMAYRDDDKPYVESIHGRRVRKVSPKRIHGKLQLRLAVWLDTWASARGEVATEWRFYFIQGEQKPSSLVPDVAYVSYERLPRSLPKDARERPRIAPDIAIEIWSPGDREGILREKITLYHAHGARLVILLYPERREMAFHTPTASETHLASGILRVPGYDDLVLDADALFQDI